MPAGESRGGGGVNRNLEFHEHLDMERKFPITRETCGDMSATCFCHRERGDGNTTYEYHS